MSIANAVARKGMVCESGTNWSSKKFYSSSGYDLALSETKLVI